MSNTVADSNVRPEPDPELVRIADYVCDWDQPSDLALETARYCLMDTLGCGMLALQYPHCVRHLGPIVAGTQVPRGARVPGTAFELDPIRATWNWGAMVRWLDYNDTWLAAEWGHPSDNLGAILPVADFLSRNAAKEGRAPVMMRDVLLAMIQAHEIQGVFALENSFNRCGLDHVLLVKLASAGVVTRMLGGSKEQVIDALSQVWVDGQSLRTYRHAPNTGSRKSWAAGDAAARAVQLAFLTLAGESGYPGAISTPVWGFEAVNFGGNKLQLNRDFADYVMENVLFKVAYPAEFHAQTAVEAAIKLHPEVSNRLEQIERIEIQTHEAALRIISKTGPLHNPADRDHCLQYMTAVAMMTGGLQADHYEDAFATNPAIDALRNSMQVVEQPAFSRDYLDPDKRSIANQIQVFFKDGSSSDSVRVEYPLGHKRRRSEGIPLLMDKFRRNMRTRFSAEQSDGIESICCDPDKLDAMAADAFTDLLCTPLSES
ncbi:MAG: bifunctional 2-methylcitrate dehydratase/aconitate hydratase [Gammaproteobacteria bacterium]